MANMSYCRFENTAHDLRDCVGAVNDAADEGQSWQEFLNNLSSDHERRAVKSLRRLCEDFLQCCEYLRDKK